MEGLSHEALARRASEASAADRAVDDNGISIDGPTAVHRRHAERFEASGWHVLRESTATIPRRSKARF